MVDAALLEQDVVPVVGGICPRGIVRIVGTCYTVLCVFRCSVVAASNDGLVVVFHVADGVNHVNFLCRLTDDTFISRGGIYVTLLTLLCSHHDYAVGTTCTVHGCGRGVLQHVEALDVFGSKAREVELRRLYTVQKNKRVGIGTCLERGNTTDIELGVHVFLVQCTGHTSSLPCNHTGNLTGKRGGEVAARHLQVFCINGGDGRNDALLLLITECHNLYFLQHLGVGLHINLQHAVGVFNCLCDGLISHEGETEHITTACFN